MNPKTSIGFPEIDDALAYVPEALEGVGGFEQRLGYKCWKVSGRRLNWLQWNDGSRPLPIQFDNDRGVMRTWKLFARFGTEPSGLWERPETYKHDHRWMLGGSDVWALSYEALRGYLKRLPELEARLKEDLKLSYRYSIERYL